MRTSFERELTKDEGEFEEKGLIGVNRWVLIVCQDYDKIFSETGMEKGREKSDDAGRLG